MSDPVVLVETDDLSTLLRTTEDRVEGARAFVEERPPQWRGR